MDTLTATFLIIFVAVGGFFGLAQATSDSTGTSTVLSNVLPKSEIPKTVNGVSPMGALKPGGIEQAIGAK